MNRILIAAVAAAVLAAAGYGFYSVGMSRGMQMAAPSNAPAPAAADGRKVLYWHDPMKPEVKFDKPGKSPFMDMDLVPVYADEAAAEGSVAISSRVQQNLGIRTAEAKLDRIAPSVEAVGNVAYNERDVAVVQARANGFVERLHVRAPLDPVRKGQPLVDLYIPEWVAAQEEFLGVKRLGGPGTQDLVEAAVQRMRLAGMTEDVVRRVESSGQAQPRITLHAPRDGVVAELAVREGMTVMAGAPLFRINDLGTVWVNAEVPESLAALVRPGAPVRARAAALPGVALEGRVSAILPEVNAATRTIKARVELANPGGRLVPGMFATIDFTQGGSREAVVVPSEAVIRTGRRNVVVVAGVGADGKQLLKPVEVEVGAESGGVTEIRKGVEPGMKVVTSGQFLIDSEASLKATATRLQEPGAAGGGTAPSGIHRGEGKVEALAHDSVTLSHAPIPELKWPAMTMEFRMKHGTDTGGAKVGSSVAFEFRDAGKGEWEVTGMQPKGGGQ